MMHSCGTYDVVFISCQSKYIMKITFKLCLLLNLRKRKGKKE